MNFAFRKMARQLVRQVARQVALTTTVLAVTAMASGCVTLQSASLTQVPVKREKKITADSTRYIFFLLNFDNDYVDKVRDDLIRKCPNGKVSGILTKDEAVVYFPLIVHGRRLHAEGYCEQNGKA